MGLFDFVLERALGIPPGVSNRHSCSLNNALNGDNLRALPPGTPVYCNFTLNIAEHSGICVGDRIVHLDGNGKIISTTPQEFLDRLDGNNLATTIYYAALRRNTALAQKDIAERALAAVGKYRGYNLLTDNCHGFTIRCITGNADVSAAWSIHEIEHAITKAFGTTAWRWRSWDGWR